MLEIYGNLMDFQLDALKTESIIREFQSIKHKQ
jgi:hypothetical protein